MGRPKEAVELLLRAITIPVSPEGLSEITTELIYANRASDCWQDAATEFAELRRLYRAQHSLVALHDDAELAGIEAQWLGGMDIKTIVEQILECCRSAVATPEHRVAAA